MRVDGVVGGEEREFILAIGPKEPRIETPAHWFIHHARNEVNAVIQINDVKYAEKLEKKLPTTEKEYPVGTLEQIKEILKCLRDSKAVIVKNQGILFIGNTLEDAENLTLKTHGELK